MEKQAFPDAFTSRSGPPEFPDPRHGMSHFIGQSVRIKSGQLSGLEGVVVKTTSDGQCIVELSQLGPGVLATLHPRQLARA